jgi:hypothetical protein
MNAEDLLYTNRFVNTNPLTQQQLNENANNFIPYRTIKNQSVDNVRDDLERTYQKDNPLTQQHLRSYGWNKGNYGNERPVLSDFARDIGESSYYRYKTSYINIDSRMRDINLFPFPNNYNIFLGRKYQNIECIKLVDYFFPEYNYPINIRNNQIVFFTIPWDMIDRKFFFNSIQWSTIITNETILNFFTDFRLLGEVNNCEDAQIKVRNNIYRNLFSFQISEGNYTTAELEKEIENKWNYLQFFNSQAIINSERTGSSYIFAEGDKITPSLYNRPQLVDVHIEPETSEVSILLRYEKLKVEYVKSYYNTNYFDLMIKTDDPLVASDEFLDLANNEIYPVHLTGIPDLGGVKEYNINVGYLPKNQVCLALGYNFLECETKLEQGLSIVNFYITVKDPDTGSIIPNLLRFYIYNQYYSAKEVNVYEPLKLSNTEKITYEDPCKLLCDARIGREAPFFLINGDQNPINQFLEQYNNNIYNLVPIICKDYYCDSIYPECNEPINNCCRCQIDKTQPFCKIVDDFFIDKFNNLLNNIDCSSRLLVNILGFFNTKKSQSTIGEFTYARGYIANYYYKLNSYIKTITTLSIAIEEATNYLDCKKTLNPPQNPSFYLTYPGSNNSNFKLPICKNSNGTYSFYFDNYMFLKIFNNGTMINTAGTEIQQIKPTSSFANGTNDIYIYTGDSVKGFGLEICSNQFYSDGTCDDPKPDVKNCDPQNSSSASTFQKLTKSVDNIFAKIKLSTMPGSCTVDNIMQNEVIFYDGSLTNMDELLIQLIDYEGKILELTQEHNFTLMIVEKIEILKETNINTRTGFINTMGSIPVNRNYGGN